MDRLDELLARNLGISKSAVARLIDEERVATLQGELVRSRRAEVPPPAVDGPGRAVVLVDGQPETLFETALVALHKPAGVVTALRDGRHPTAFALLAEAPLASLLRPVGRLDLDTTGLLLWTTEGALIQRLTHPKRRVARTYQAALTEPFRTMPAELTLEDGHRPEVTELVEIAREDAHPALLVPPETRTLASITIVGGAYHEVRRNFAALGSHVAGLCRVRFGTFDLPPDLPAGGWRSLPVPSPP